MIVSRLKWKVGNGTHISLNHPLWWLMQVRTFDLTNPSRVSDLLMHALNSLQPLQWNCSLLHRLYPHTIANAISLMPLSIVVHSDQLFWNGNSFGHNKVKGGFLLYVLDSNSRSTLKIHLVYFSTFQAIIVHMEIIT